MVVLVSLTVGGRLANWLGPGAKAALGSLLFASGVVIWLSANSTVEEPAVT
jgi:hypothetical protein